MKRIIQSLLFVGITAILTQFAFSQVKPKAPKKEVSLYQDRVWTNNDGKKVTARAVAKSDDKVTLRMTDGKRVQVAIDQLSKEDSEWLGKWIQPVIKVSSEIQTIYGPKKNTSVRRFVFRRESVIREYFYGHLTLYEYEFPLVVAAIKEFIVLASKPLSDIDQYKKVLYTRKAVGGYTAVDLLVFEVMQGKPLLGVDGSGRLKPTEALEFQDFLETFSVRDWDKQQEEIKRRFE
jgi:hypothetical protein